MTYIPPVSPLGASGAAASVQKPQFAAGAAPARSFSEVLQAGAADMVQAVQHSEAASAAAVADKASLQETVQAVVAAEMTVETTVAVRNKLIESFQEIYRMPV